ncbi:methyl-accepting chemotaxis protein [Methanocalculus alkaliphilus]|uniref:Cache 3/Cache 2 fusion domain-containing protein n=1 Tax=Methanocalculus alkaliphilus TaxID=768730 RepID=UPI0020A0B0EE|nr:Cache 3/Cache 2 fusion domain-containing protein [Methanocalculus alkaliphilus]MCP1714436.1 methyl-accepting chemotaxis protein [Methanocalculus alkaliphilus]
MSNGIMERFQNMKIGTKILIICIALVVLPTVLLGIVAYNSASGAIEEQVETQFNLIAQDTRQETESVYTLTMQLVQGGLNVLRYTFNAEGTPEIRDGQLVLVNAAGQVYVVNDNHELVDSLSNQLDGAAATIFQVQGNQAIRVSTSVFGADGRRVVGTPIAQQVYDVVVTRGETFYGTANVVGVDYITAYEPIRNAQGAVIGILFVGIPEQATLGVIQQNIRDTVVGQTGYMYVMDSTGTLLIHPTMQGQSLAQHDFARQILTERDGVIRYYWEGDDMIASFAYYPDLDWYIVAGADWADFTGPINDIRNAILAIVIGAVIIGGGIAILFGRGIARRMDELVALGRRVTDGDLSGTVQTDRSGDEIGQVAGAFGDVVTTIQRFGSEMNMISAAAAEGRLDVRGDASQFKGDYGRIIGGVNETLDSVIGPLNVAAEYVERISNGDVPEKITDEYKGDFNEIKNNLNKCIDAVDLLVEDANYLAAGAVEGNLSARADGSRHQGDFKRVIDGLNNTLDAVVRPLNGMAKSINRISNGDIPEKITAEFAGDYNQMKVSVNKCIDAINMLIDDANLLAAAAVEGKLATRADASKHHGDYRKVIDGLNNTLDAIVKPVNEVIRIADAFANADFSTRFSEDVVARGDMEKLKNAMNNTSTQVSVAIADVSRLMEELAAISEEANASVEEVSSGAQQIARNTGRVSENSERSNNGARQVLRAMEDLSAAVEEVTSNAESVASLARNADDQSKEGAKLAAAAEKGIGEISHSAADVDAIIKDINDQMNQIGKIVGLIADISNQTNLLALNAAIEAARAGDAGRGFAVVAAEVKSLAQESGSSAESIASMIGDLQTKAKRAVEAMGTANTAVEAGSDQMEQTIKAFNQIVDSVEKISRAIEEVASAAEEQAATVEEITASVHEVTGLIEENAREAGDAAAATEEASAGIDEVAKMIENVSEVANKTLRANQKFKLAK